MSKDDLRLSLSLSFSSDALPANKSSDIGMSSTFQMSKPSSSLASSHHHLQLNLMTVPTSSSTASTTTILPPPPAPSNNQITLFPHHFSASADRASMDGSTRVATTIGVLITAPPPRSINVLTNEPPPARSINALTTATPPRSSNVNRLPESNDAGVSSPNSTISSVSGKRCERESASASDEDDDGGETSRKKLRLSKDQSLILEDTFKQHNTLNPKQKLALAKRLGLRPRQVEVWFQNRRARTKLKQTEVDCEFMKKCCEQLTEENRRLQKEVQELRALKLSPHFLMQMTPPTTLTICTSCDFREGFSSSQASHPQGS